MTVCPKCNGRGTVGYYHIDHFVDIECDRCNGSGEVPMTNEEWLHTLNTEQLAEWIFKICERATWDYKVKIMVGEKKKELIMEWLKQPHTPKE